VAVFPTLFQRYVLLTTLLLSLFLTGCAQVETFPHEIKVEAAGTGQPIAGATVFARMGVRDAVQAKSDANGLATLAIEEQYRGAWIKVVVAAADYQEQSLLVELVAGSSPTVVQLQPADAPTPTPEATPAAAVTAEIPADTAQSGLDSNEPAVDLQNDTPPAGAAVANLPPAERANYFPARPDIAIDTGRVYRATIQTSKGDIVVSLDATAAPEHVNNFIYLSKAGFYNGLTFHRVEPGFVIQGGDPLGSGQGGPGYTLPGEFDLTHGEGALAMARLPDEVNPNRESSGSQFYITLAPTPALDGQYSVFGRVEQGMDVVRAIKRGDLIEQIIIDES